MRAKTESFPFAPEQKHIYALGFFVLLVTAFFSAGFHHFDEHFQILEFAALKLNLTTEKDLPWEYANKMRPALQPAIVFCLSKAMGVLFTPDPFAIATITRLLSAVLSFFATLLFIKNFQGQIQSQKLRQVFVYLSFGLWFVVYNQVRFSSENWSGNFFLIALCLAASKSAKTWFSFFCIGLTLGLSFLFRYQTGFLIAGLFIWQLFIAKEKIVHLTTSVLAILLMVGMGILIDRWFYSTWTFTTWNYFDQNILQNKAASFGVEPWWYYLKEVLLNAIPPFSLIYIIAPLLFFFYQSKSPITFSLLPFLLIHFIIGHKELRFLFPIVLFLPYVMVVVFEKTEAYSFSATWKRLIHFFAITFLAINALLLAVVMFKPADGLVSLYDKIYHDYKGESVLYYTDENPYLRVINLNFYKRSNLEVAQIAAVADIKPQQGRKILFSTTRPDLLQSSAVKWRLVYSALPEWLKPFNFNHWQQRTRFWYVYELDV